MNNQPILYGVIGLLVGVGIATYTASTAVNTNNANMMRMMGMRGNTNPQELTQKDSMMGMDASMDDMMLSMMDKSSDEFDKAFLSAMIVHHDGAIEMAKQAKINAKHPEIKDMAQDIIDTQTKEINQMKMWQTQWGY
ncbi:DUF305 domain-containing protein [Patescibacteria group bacterium]|nr:DUF305 domain-containing protein [Patescibacteria group bacterium]